MYQLLGDTTVSSNMGGEKIKKLKREITIVPMKYTGMSLPHLVLIFPIKMEGEENEDQSLKGALKK